MSGLARETKYMQLFQLSGIFPKMNGMNGMAPDYLSKQFVNRGSISGHCTRNSQSLNIPLYKSVTAQRTFYYRAVALWNDLPVNIKTSTTLNIFKINLRRHLFETLTL